MGMFSKFKGAKNAAHEHKNTSAADEAPKERYRHIPTHAAVDALSGAPSSWKSDDRSKIREQNQRRSQMMASQSMNAMSSHYSGNSSPITATPSSMVRNSSYNSYNPTWWARGDQSFHNKPQRQSRRSQTPSYAEAPMGPNPLVANVVNSCREAEEPRALSRQSRQWQSPGYCDMPAAVSSPLVANAANNNKEAEEQFPMKQSLQLQTPSCNGVPGSPNPSVTNVNNCNTGAGEQFPLRQSQQLQTPTCNGAPVSYNFLGSNFMNDSNEVEGQFPFRQSHQSQTPSYISAPIISSTLVTNAADINREGAELSASASSSMASVTNTFFTTDISSMPSSANSSASISSSANALEMKGPKPRPQKNTYEENEIFNRLHTSTTRKIGEAPVNEYPPTTKGPAKISKLSKAKASEKKSWWTKKSKGKEAAIAVGVAI